VWLVAVVVFVGSDEFWLEDKMSWAAESMTT